jgi:membrane protein implicated in regulation of membrane protease activity
MELKGAKPGRFQPACPACHEKFILTVPADTTVAPSVRAIGETLPPSITMALGIEEQKPAPRATQATVPQQRVGDPPAKPGPLPAPTPTEVPPTIAPTPEQLAAVEPQVERRLNGYELVRKLGQGGMGAVYLARQLSLDRNVALKVLLPHFGTDPQFVSRFIREAYAAAQLTHHNVVQIHDIGAQKRTHFFSMEFVEGHTLAGLLRERGPMDSEMAVNYVLQAARGLKFAHEHGMVHRDVKPENLMLNIHGIVKVADLGLVKVPTAPREKGQAAASKEAAEGKWYDDETTQLNVSMGTPSYMPPEQATDAHNVDVRADIYALGCTLYAMVTGRPPFSGHSAIEVITKHMREPVTPPDRLVEHVPEFLSKIVMKMLAKKPEGRYQSMTSVIAALEEFVGVKSTGPFEPTAAQAATLARCVNDFNKSAWAKVRSRIIAAFLPICAMLVIAAFFLPLGTALKYQIAAGVVGFAVLAPAIYLLIQGLHDKTYLFSKVRDYVLGGGAVQLFFILAVLTAAAGLLILLNIQWAWLIALAATIAAAGAFHYLIDPTVTAEQSGPVTHAEAMLKQIRTKSAASEAALEQFVCKHGGEKWEGLFEAIFGYEAKIEARKQWGALTETIGRAGKGDRRRPRPKHAAWRDGVIEWIDMRLRARREAKDRKFLELVERESLKARGFPDAAAQKKARELAGSIVAKAADLREAAREGRLAETAPPPPEEQKHDGDAHGDEESEEQKKRKRRPVLDDEGLEGYEHLSYFQRRYGGWAGFFLGPPVRLALGAILLAACVLWVKQNDLLPTQVPGVAHGSEETSSTATARAPQGKRDAPPAPLHLRHVPNSITHWVNGWHVGIAGAMLIISALLSRPALGLWLIPAAAVMVFGAGALSGAREPIRQGVPVVAGLVVAMIGARSSRD